MYKTLLCITYHILWPHHVWPRAVQVCITHQVSEHTEEGIPGF